MRYARCYIYIIHRPHHARTFLILRHHHLLSYHRAISGFATDGLERRGIVRATVHGSGCSPEVALGGDALREALGVGAVVVDHELPLHPPHAAVAHVAQLLSPPAAPAHGGGLHGAHGALLPPAGPQAGVGAEAPERGHERRVGPVRLHAPALRRPVVGVPQARVQPHRLALGERHAARLVVLEVTDRGAVHREAASKSKLGCQRPLRHVSHRKGTNKEDGRRRGDAMGVRLT
jgi:hypothetical protein